MLIENLEYNNSVRKSVATINDCTISADSTLYFPVDYYYGRLYKYGLSVQNDVLSLVSYGFTSYSAWGNSYTGVDISPNGLILVLLDYTANNILFFSLASAYNIDNPSHLGTLSLASYGTYPESVRFGDKDDTVFVALSDNGPSIKKFSVSYSPLSITLSDSNSISYITAITFTDNGRTLLNGLGTANTNIKQYSLSLAYDISSLTLVSEFLSPYPLKGLVQFDNRLLIEDHTTGDYTRMFSFPPEIPSGTFIPQVSIL